MINEFCIFGDDCWSQCKKEHATSLLSTSTVQKECKSSPSLSRSLLVYHRHRSIRSWQRRYGSLSATANAKSSAEPGRIESSLPSSAHAPATTWWPPPHGTFPQPPPVSVSRSLMVRSLGLRSWIRELFNKTNEAARQDRPPAEKGLQLHHLSICLPCPSVQKSAPRQDIHTNLR